MSFKSRSYCSAQMCESLRVSINWAFMCSQAPVLRTLPSSTCETRSASPIWRVSRLPRYCITLVRLMTLRAAIFASLVKRSSWTPSAKEASSLSLLRFSNGSTAIPAAAGRRNRSLFQTITPTVAISASDNVITAAIAGFLRTHFFPRAKSPVRRARIGSCFSQRSRSSASARAEA